MCRFQRTPEEVTPRILSPEGTTYFGKFSYKVNLIVLPYLVLVGVTGFEPVTLRLSSACSNQLSYTPDRAGLCPKRFELVELRRFELLTFCLQSRRSTN